MKRLLCAAAVLALVTPQVAAAQSHDRDRHNAQQAQAQRRQAARQQHATAARTEAVRQQAARQRHGIAVHTQAVRQQAARQQHGIAVHTQAVRRQAARQQEAARDRAHRAAGYHPTHVQRVHAAAFRYPHGYSYRRWNAGSVLPRLFRSPTYYYTNWYDLGFGPPPPSFRWVRYGPDLLLVNVYTGRIRDVVYNVFY
ncbi:RcnB family protein [Sphingomonas sp.]|uniref:RcnB family protein n=1 Tax=Sphingomonas sp. TaxID=28214 RepID=UPI0025F62B12|nr:RcnB family protein [Sphingomonas sp.]MBV9526742.1 RcnB family protein [Sphingomonas sp.]